MQNEINYFSNFNSFCGVWQKIEIIFLPRSESMLLRAERRKFFYFVLQNLIKIPTAKKKIENRKRQRRISISFIPSFSCFPSRLVWVWSTKISLISRCTLHTFEFSFPLTLVELTQFVSRFYVDGPRWNKLSPDVVHRSSFGIRWDAILNVVSINYLVHIVSVSS